MIPKIEWPEGKQFAFTIFDDPDHDTVENVADVYSFLDELGMRTTKAVWPIHGNGIPEVDGTTCEDERYLRWILALQEKGFEIALHNVTYHSSTRGETTRGLEVFHQLFGHYPYSMANHANCSDSIYWGAARLSGGYQAIYKLLRLKPFLSNAEFQGHIETSPFFWGDLCRDKIKYVRNFVFSEINTLKACPTMPYHDHERPYVNYWFAASEGPSCKSLNATISEANQDRLMSEGGACIIYTHLAADFVEGGKLNRRFKFLMERLSSMNGWFVPVRTLLDFILQAKGNHSITQVERSGLERRWLCHKILYTRGRS